MERVNSVNSEKVKSLSEQEHQLKHMQEAIRGVGNFVSRALSEFNFQR